MALIICEKCGNKVSDTVDICIHCGANIKQGNNLCLNNQAEISVSCEKEEPEKVVRDFTFYSAEERIALEKEFLNNDKWAKKYRQKHEELPSFFRAAMLSFGWALMIIIISITMEESLTETMLMLSPGREIFAFSAIALFLFFVITIICRLIVKIHLKLTFAKYIYMKKFQAWLYTEKSIDYFPPLSKIKEKNIFDSIDLNSLKI